MAITGSKPKSDVKVLNQHIRDARFVHAEWHNEAWRDEEMIDNEQWSESDKAKAADAEIDMLTINMIFPVVNLILGHYELNPQDIIAKARTKEDGEIAQTMTEAIKYVRDVNEGQFRVQQAFRDSCVPGFGAQEVCLQPDPRYETVKHARRRWQDVLWDPFGSPWLEPGECRHVIYQPWLDLEELIALFPSRKREIEDKFAQLTGDTYTDTELGDFHEIFDDAQGVEEYKRRLIGGGWANKARRRVRPVEIWHTIFMDCLFAKFRNGSVFEIREEAPVEEQFRLMNQADEIVRSRVRKVVLTTLMGDLVLQDSFSPFDHDLFPHVPWIGYLDRYGLPYGVVRNLRDQNVEVNKRRSMALSLLGAKRVVAESNIGGSEKERQSIFEEAQKVNGFVLVAPSDDGTPLGHRILIQDQSQLAQGEIALMQQSKEEIQAISGANDEQMGYRSNATSGIALQERKEQGATILATLFGNARRSLHMLGVKTMGAVQQYWTGPKILRVTDRMSGAEKFVEINRMARDAEGNTIVLNRINQSKFDIVVSQSPAHDTIREQNMNLLLETIKKSPPEAAPVLIAMAFELSNLPNKEALMLKLRPLLGMDPSQDDKSPEQIKEEAIAAMEAQKEQQAKMAQLEERKLSGEAEAAELEARKLVAEIRKVEAETRDTLAEAEQTAMETELLPKKAGVEALEKARRFDLEERKAGVDALDKAKRNRIDELKAQLDAIQQAVGLLEQQAGQGQQQQSREGSDVTVN
jgi:hypothetical protein